MKRTSYIITTLFLFIFPLLRAQQLNFNHFTSENGLSTILVRKTIQDDKGFMWFATQDGLNKFDGYAFKVFRKNPTDENSLPASDIYSLYQFSPDLIIVGTIEGLAFFNPVNETCQRLKKGSINLGSIKAVGALNDSVALVGTKEGLFTINIRTRELIRSCFEKKDTINVNFISTLNGIIYAGSDRGLFKVNKDASAQKLNIVGPRSDNKESSLISTVSSIAAYDEKYYLACNGLGILQLDKNYNTEKLISFSGFNANADYIRALTVFDKKIYAASAHGLYVYSIHKAVTSAYLAGSGANSLNSNDCNDVFFDNSDNCWVATNLGGLNVVFARAQRLPVSERGYETAYRNIFSFSETSPGKILVGGVKTFHEIDLATGDITNYSGFLGPGTALCILKENQNTFWIGTWGSGLYRFDLTTKKTVQVLRNDMGGTIICLKYLNGKIYAGSVEDGLFRVDPASFEVVRFAVKEGLPSNTISDIFTDANGNCWLASFDKGLSKMKRLDENNLWELDKNYSNNGKEGEIASNEVRQINQDKKGNLWLATAAGLSKMLPNGTFRNYYEQDGITNTNLYSLLKDSAGNFWMSSNAGIMKFNPTIDDDKISFKAYTNKDGLVNTEFTMNAFYLTSQGLACFGGANGFNIFRPSFIKDSPHLPEIYVTGYKRGGKDVPIDSLIQYKKALNLNWRENYFQFELTGLDYADPGKVQFSYMLEGYDSDWSEPSTVRYVSYTELPGGEYTFKVKAANSDGVWNDKPYEIKITVVPPFWKTRWFYVLCIIVVIGGFITYTQLRTRAIKEKNRVLEAKVAERTKELHEKNMDIMASINYAKRIQEAMLPAKDQVYGKLEKVFILYRPKDIVSGDFYWFGEKNGVRILACVDCTGHGVPGAFMSMIGHNQLNQIVMEKGVTDPGEILNRLHRGIQGALRQGHNEISTNDGMDCSLLAINSNGKASWAGANRPLVMITTDGQFSRLEGDKFPVGGVQAHVDRVFTTHNLETSSGTMCYMFSDGYADQFGGEKGKKFMVKRLHELLTTIYHKPAAEQRDELEKQLLDWKKDHEQVDDVLVTGVGL